MTEAYHETPTNVVDITGDGEHVSQAVLIARQNIQGMNARDLLVGLTRVYGVQSEVFVLHQLCYWFGRPKMQNRWALWKTYQEWRDESGLNRKQVDKARRGLKADGVVVETKGQHQRIFYRVDWVKLWEMLNTGERWPKDDVSNDDADPPFDESLSDPPRGYKESLTPLGVADISDPPRGYKEFLTPLRGTKVSAPLKGHRLLQKTTPETTSVENPEESLSINPVLQTGGKTIFCFATPGEIKEKEPLEPWPGEVVIALSPDKAELDPNLLSEVRTILCDDHGAELLAKQRAWEIDLADVLLFVGKEMRRHPGEYLRDHVREAARQLGEEKDAAEEPDLAEDDAF